MLQGIAYKVASTFVFACMAAIVKAHAEAFPAAELVFFRSFFALPVVVAWLWQRGDFPRALQTRRLGGHLLRSVSGVGSMFLTFTAYGFLPLADVTVVGYAAPLIIVVLAALLLKERVGPGRWAGVALGFFGVLMMLWQHLGSSDPATTRGAVGALCALAGAFCVAVAMIQTRRLVQSEHMGAVMFYFQSTGAVLGLLVTVLGALWPSHAPFAATMQAQAWIMPSWPVFWVLVLSGAFGGVGQLLMTRSFMLADASIIACFDYTSMIFVLILGVAFLGEWPTPMVLIGAATIACAGLMVILSERRRKPRIAA
jgi:drug/metabolite transporter (DMT)-like permease